MQPVHLLILEAGPELDQLRWKPHLMKTYRRLELEMEAERAKLEVGAEGHLLLLQVQTRRSKPLPRLLGNEVCSFGSLVPKMISCSLEG